MRCIAMASDGQLAMRLDTNPGPAPDLHVQVCRAATYDRGATLALWLPTEAMCTPHIWQHIGLPVNYELADPWIQRIGLKPGRNLAFSGNMATVDPAVLKQFDYAVIGDCTTVAGLEAPFDEENTTQTFVVQDLAGSDIFTFWRENANTHMHANPLDTLQFDP